MNFRHNHSVSLGLGTAVVVLLVAATAAFATPTLLTAPQPTSGTLAVTILSDQATLSGANSPTGTITFTLFDPDDPICSGAPRFLQQVAVTGNGAYQTSVGFLADKTGTWNWVASYGGDANNIAVSTLCADEPVTISKPVLTIQKTPDVPGAGSTFHAGDTITFTIVVTNAGPGLALNVTLSDLLPDPNSSLSWSVASTACSGQSGGSPACSIAGSPGTQQISCSFFNLSQGGTCSVAVSTATLSKDCPLTLNNTAFAQADNANRVADAGSMSCERVVLIQLLLQIWAWLCKLIGAC